MHLFTIFTLVRNYKKDTGIMFRCLKEIEENKLKLRFKFQ